MADGSLGRPAGVPNLPGRIADGMRQAAANPGSRPRAYVQLTASGGAHSERYVFEYRVDSMGNVSSSLHDDLKDRHHEATRERKRQADPEAFRRLVDSIDVDALVRAEQAATGFPPDSLVGRLEISDGEQSTSFVFLADDVQAARAERQLNQPLRHAIDAIYRSASAHLEADDLKP
ncbi:hypothetical protein ACSMXN_08205 [Jatrophihabitans sp. DSM 45814]